MKRSFLFSLAGVAVLALGLAACTAVGSAHALSYMPDIHAAAASAADPAVLSTALLATAGLGVTAAPLAEAGHVDATGDSRVVNNTMRHAYRVLSDEEKGQMQAIKDKGLELHALIESVGASRELALAKTKTEEAVMWAVKHITA